MLSFLCAEPGSGPEGLVKLYAGQAGCEGMGEQRTCISRGGEGRSRQRPWVGLRPPNRFTAPISPTAETVLVPLFLNKSSQSGEKLTGMF